MTKNKVEQVARFSKSVSGVTYFKRVLEYACGTVEVENLTANGDIESIGYPDATFEEVVTDFLEASWAIATPYFFSN